MLMDDERPRRNWVTFGIQVSLAVLTGILALWIWSVDGGTIWVLYAALSVGAATSAAMRLGWVPTCTIAGIVAGDWSDPTVKGGPVDAQMWETAGHLAGGLLVGLLVGLFLDQVSRLIRPGGSVE